jgi:hypothetical protein
MNREQHSNDQNLVDLLSRSKTIADVGPLDVSAIENKIVSRRRWRRQASQGSILLACGILVGVFFVMRPEQRSESPQTLTPTEANPSIAIHQQTNQQGETNIPLPAAEDTSLAGTEDAASVQLVSQWEHPLMQQYKLSLAEEKARKAKRDYILAIRQRARLDYLMKITDPG